MQLIIRGFAPLPDQFVHQRHVIGNQTSHVLPCAAASLGARRDTDLSIREPKHDLVTGTDSQSLAIAGGDHDPSTFGDRRGNSYFFCHTALSMTYYLQNVTHSSRWLLSCSDPMGNFRRASRQVKSPGFSFDLAIGHRGARVLAQVFGPAF